MDPIEPLEVELNKCLADLTGAIGRLGTLDTVMDKIVEISRYKRSCTATEDMEEYYIEQINRWMAFGDAKLQEVALKDALCREKDRKYLNSLKRIKELEKSNTDIQSKYEYYKGQAVHPESLGAAAGPLAHRATPELN